jgi:hypothetical protein
MTAFLLTGEERTYGARRRDGFGGHIGVTRLTFDLRPAVEEDP